MVSSNNLFNRNNSIDDWIFVRLNKADEHECEVRAKNAEIIRENINALETSYSTFLSLNDLLKDGDYPTANQAINAIKTIVACYYSSRKNGSEIKLKDLDKKNQEIFKWA